MALDCVFDFALEVRFAIASSQALDVALEIARDLTRAAHPTAFKERRAGIHVTSESTLALDQ